MFRLRTIAIVFTLMAVVGCSQSSLPLSRSTISRDALEQDHLVGQDFLESASHWQILAADTAISLVGCLDGKTYLSNITGLQEPYCRLGDSSLGDKPLYLELADSSVPFSEAFRELLTTELVNRGRQVSMNQDDALAVKFRVQFVKREGQVPLNSVPGTYALLGAGVWALESWGVGELIGLGTLADIYVAANEFGGSQIIVTTSLMDNDRFIMRKTGSYFIHDVDVRHYVSNAPGSGVASPRKPGAVSPGVRTFTVNAE